MKGSAMHAFEPVMLCNASCHIDSDYHTLDPLSRCRTQLRLCSIQACLAWWNVVSPFGGWGSSLALAFVLIVAAIKAIWEDAKRHQEDRRTNASVAHRYMADGALLCCLCVQTMLALAFMLVQAAMSAMKERIQSLFWTLAGRGLLWATVLCPKCVVPRCRPQCRDSASWFLGLPLATNPLSYRFALRGLAH